MRFHDRQEGGRRLASLLQRYEREEPIVLALPRGGVPVGYEVARALRAPLDVLVVRKLGAPLFREYAIGAIAEGGVVLVERDAMAEAGVSASDLEAITEHERVELERRVRHYRGDRPLPDVRGRTVLLVDDGIATGRTTRAAIRALRRLEPRKLVLAAPVVAAQTVEALRGEVDDLVCVHAPEDFVAVGLWYEEFGQTSDDEVVGLLERARATDRGQRDQASSSPRREPVVDPPAVAEQELVIPVGDRRLGATVAVPPDAKGIVLFAHGSGSSRFSPRNRLVARALRDAGLATLLLDLLTADEGAEDDRTGRLRFDVELLASRLAAAARFVGEHAALRQLRVGFFGASTGAAAALLAAAHLGQVVGAVVSRGGRPDLAGPDVLRLVRAPTLLIVGGADTTVLALNRAALEQLTAEKKLVIVPGATHLFEEPGALDVVADAAAGWFVGHAGQAREQART